MSRVTVLSTTNYSIGYYVPYRERKMVPILLSTCFVATMSIFEIMFTTSKIASIFLLTSQSLIGNIK